MRAFLHFSYLSCRLFCAVVPFFFFFARQRGLLIALLSRVIHPFLPLLLQPRCFSFRSFLLFVSFFRCSPLSLHRAVSSALLLFLPPLPIYSLGELYPVNRGTLLVTLCNLTEDQTKRDLTYLLLAHLPYILLFSYLPELPYAFTEDVYVEKRTVNVGEGPKESLLQTYIASL